MIIDNLTIFGILIVIGSAVILSRLVAKEVSEVSAPRSRRPLQHH